MKEAPYIVRWLRKDMFARIRRDEWMAKVRRERIRDAVKDRSKTPPAVRFPVTWGQVVKAIGGPS